MIDDVPPPPPTPESVYAPQTRLPDKIDVDVHLVRTPGVYSYFDVQWVDCAVYALRRIRRSRPGWHAMLAVGFVRIYLGVGP
jgi:hypothetical protein